MIDFVNTDFSTEKVEFVAEIGNIAVFFVNHESIRKVILLAPHNVEIDAKDVVFKALKEKFETTIGMHYEAFIWEIECTKNAEIEIINL